MKILTVFIADGHSLAREGLISLLKRQGCCSIAGETKNNENLIFKIKNSNPDCIIIDFDIPGRFTIYDLTLIHNHFPDKGILVITGNRKKQDILFALDKGVSGYLLKECDEEEIMSAIKAVSKKDKFICGKVLDIILSEDRIRCSTGDACEICGPVKLSNRELEIVKLIARGMTTKSIADQLYLSHHTVATHRKNIFKKIGINNSLELIRYAMNNNIISLQQDKHPAKYPD